MQQLRLALQGRVVLSEALDRMHGAIADNAVPPLWGAAAYPSLKPLAAWLADLRERVAFLRAWLEDGPPAVFYPGPVLSRVQR